MWPHLQTDSRTAAKINEVLTAVYESHLSRKHQQAQLHGFSNQYDTRQAIGSRSVYTNTLSFLFLCSVILHIINYYHSSLSCE